jgi:hypothetical protein
MTVTPYGKHGPINFLIDTAASTSEIGTSYLDAGCIAVAVDTGQIQVYNGSTWVDSHDAAGISIADAGAYTAVTDVEAALQELYSHRPRADFLAADFDVDSGTTGATPTATGLALPVEASTSYAVEASLFATATTNGGIEISFTGPASATAVLHANIFQDTGNIVNDGEMDLTGAVNYIAAALSFDRIEIQGVLTVAATAGTFTILGAQDTGHADNTIIHAGSFLTLTRISA